MYSTAGGPAVVAANPARSAGGVRFRRTDLPLRLARIVRVGFAEPVDRVRDPAVVEFLDDASVRNGARPGGREVAGTAFASMARRLVAHLAAVGETDRPFDLVVVAHATPDLHPWQSAATYLTHALPGEPLTFGVTEQPVSTAFTALRVIGGYARRHGYRRALLVLVDQSTDSLAGASAPQPGGDAAVALVLDAGAGSSVSVERFHGVDAAAARTLLAERATRLGAARVLAGPGLRTGRAGAGDRPCTGIWRDPVGTTLYAEHEPERAELSLCLVRPGPDEEGR